MPLDKKTVRDLDAAGKTVLVRCDFNVPLRDGHITDDRRITEALPTIQHLQNNGASVVLCSHLGRPKSGPNLEFSLAPVAARLSELLHQPVPLAPDCIGEEVESAVARMGKGDVLLLENLRFHAEEEKNDPGFAAALAKGKELFVNDAFGTAHRAHASTVGVTAHLPAVAGFLIEKEIMYLGNAVESPRRPFLAILGGAKVSDKIKVIDSLLSKVDNLVIGGGMAFTFLRAQGLGIGKSLLDYESLDYAAGLMRDHDDRIALPVDVVVAKEMSETAETRAVSVNEIPEDMIGLDIGPVTQRMFAGFAQEAGTVVWNGPMGVFEMKPFEAGTLAVARGLSECRGTTIVGGGDSAAAIEQFGLEKTVTHVSTGGGASLEFLEGIELPGIAALLDK